MANKTRKMIRDLDFVFSNSSARVIANRNCPEIRLAGLTVGPLEEGNEYETHYWAAQELERSGIVHFREDESINTAKLNKIQWTERVQTVGQMSKLPDDFYPRMRRCLADLRINSTRAPERMLECEKARQLIRDIVNSRLRKVVSIASAPAQTEHSFKNFTKEERYLYDQLYSVIKDWRTQITEYEETEE